MKHENKAAIESIFDGLLWYLLFFVKRIWSSLSLEEKLTHNEYICNRIIAERQNEPFSWLDYGKADIFMNRFLRMIERSSGHERKNLLTFIEESGFMENMCVHFDDRKRRYYKDSHIESLIKSFEFGEHRAASIVFCNIYFHCSKRMQLAMKEIIDLNLTNLPFSAVVRGIFTGAVKYEEKIREIIINELESSVVNLQAFEMANPVYVLSVLFLYGYVDQYELIKYQDCCDKSMELTYLIYQEKEILEYMDESWKSFFLKNNL